MVCMNSGCFEWLFWVVVCLGEWFACLAVWACFGRVMRFWPLCFIMFNMSLGICLWSTLLRLFWLVWIRFGLGSVLDLSVGIRISRFCYVLGIMNWLVIGFLDLITDLDGLQETGRGEGDEAGFLRFKEKELSKLKLD